MVIELLIIFPNWSLFQNAEKHFFILLIDADGHADRLFSRLIRSHCKAIAIKVTYVKKYNHEQEKDAKVPSKVCYPFGPALYY